MNHGFENLIDGYISVFMGSLTNNIHRANNILDATNNIHQIVDKIVSDAISDIDNRLNRPQEDYQEG